jgi:hypothetical protein
MTHLRDAGIDLAIAGTGFTLYNLAKEVLGFPWMRGLLLLPICLNLSPCGLTLWPYVPKLLGIGLFN